MADFIKSMAMSASGMSTNASRLRVVSENIANSKTPGYQRKLLSFEQAYDRQTGVNLIRPGQMSLDDAELKRVFEPSHPMADEDGYFDSSNVNTIIETADAREAQRSYEANLRMFDQARQMSSSLLEILRR